MNQKLETILSVAKAILTPDNKTYVVDLEEHGLKGKGLYSPKRLALIGPINAHEGIFDNTDGATQILNGEILKSVDNAYGNGELTVAKLNTNQRYLFDTTPAKPVESIPYQNPYFKYN